MRSDYRERVKQVLPAEKAIFVAQGIAALIDGIWLRGALNPKGFCPEKAQQSISDYLENQLAPYSN